MALNNSDGGFPPLAPNASQLPHAISHRGWGLVGQIAYPAFFAVVIVLVGWGMTSSPNAPGLNPIFAVVALAIVAAVGYRLWQLQSPWLILYPDRLEKRGLTGWRTFGRTDMAGFRTVSDRSGSWLIIDPKTEQPGQGSVRIPKSVRDDPVANRWLAGLTDLDAAAFAAAKAEVLADPRYGADTAQREARLTLAKRVAMAFNVACVAAAAYLFFAVPANIVILGVGVAAFAVGMLLIQASQGLLVWGDPARVRPSLIGAGAPPFAMAILALNKFHILNLALMSVIVAGLTLGLVALVYFRTNAGVSTSSGQSLTLGAPAPATPPRRSFNPTQAFLGLGLAAAFLVYGLAAFANAALDLSKVQVFPQTVLGKHASHGKSTTYYVNTGPWSDQGGGDVSIPPSLYDDLSIGSTVCFFRQSGALGIAWFRAGRCPAGTPAPIPLADNPAVESPIGSADINNKANPN